MDAANSMRMHGTTEKGVEEALALDFLIEAVGVASGKFYSGEDIEDDRVAHFHFFESGPAADQGNITEPEDAAGFPFQRAIVGLEIHACEGAVDDGNIEIQSKI